MQSPRHQGVFVRNPPERDMSTRLLAYSYPSLSISGGGNEVRKGWQDY
jgi:hypothetical protein